MTTGEMNGLEKASEDVPREVVESILREHLADPSVTLTDLAVQPFVSDGNSGNNTLYRVQFAWSTAGDGPLESAEWILKCWRPGGWSENFMGLTQPQEALAWRHNLITPVALPAGFTTPFIGAALGPDGTKAWIAMVDVSTELGRYSWSQPLPPEVALGRVKQILDGFARFHALWEQPQRRGKLAEYSWLLPWEDRVWGRATTLAHMLDKAPMGGRGKGEPEREKERRVDMYTFLDWLAPEDQLLWEELMCDRRLLLAAFQEVPRTLIHGDPDPRNVGLRCTQGEGDTDQDIDSSTEIVLIDWEAIGIGPAPFDAAYVLWWLPLVCDPFQPCPEFCWSDELPEYYFDRYIAAGGKGLSHEAFTRCFHLAGLLPSLWFVPARAGNTLRSLQGFASIRYIVGIPEEETLGRLKTLWDMLEHKTEMATRTMRRWLV